MGFYSSQFSNNKFGQFDDVFFTAVHLDRAWCPDGRRKEESRKSQARTSHKMGLDTLYAINLSIKPAFLLFQTEERHKCFDLHSRATGRPH